jgi:hypothetical protein
LWGDLFSNKEKIMKQNSVKVGNVKVSINCFPGNPIFDSRNRNQEIYDLEKGGRMVFAVPKEALKTIIPLFEAEGKLAAETAVEEWWKKEFEKAESEKFQELKKYLETEFLK